MFVNGEHFFLVIRIKGSEIVKIYFAIYECEDLECHFDLRGIYLSKKDLLEDLSAIKEDGSSVYSCEDSMFINPKINRGSLHQENMSELLNELNE
jgi:hypothetical protein